MDEMEPVAVVMIATCHTPGCPAQPTTQKMYGLGDPPVFLVQCGQCGQPITDLVPVDAA